MRSRTPASAACLVASWGWSTTAQFGRTDGPVDFTGWAAPSTKIRNPRLVNSVLRVQPIPSLGSCGPRIKWAKLSGVMAARLSFEGKFRRHPCTHQGRSSLSILAISPRKSVLSSSSLNREQRWQWLFRTFKIVISYSNCIITAAVPAEANSVRWQYAWLPHPNSRFGFPDQSTRSWATCLLSLLPGHLLDSIAMTSCIAIVVYVTSNNSDEAIDYLGRFATLRNTL